MLEGKRLLVVDDDEGITRELTHLLSEKGCQITTASNADEALNKIAKNRGYELVITDIFMPGKDGFKMIHEIQQMGAQVKVLVISGGKQNAVGVDSDETELRVENFNTIRLLAKPFSSGEIVKEVEDLLKL